MYVQPLKQLFIFSCSELLVTVVIPMVSVPEDDGSPVNVCLETNIGIKEPLEVDVTASEKGTPGSASKHLTCLQSLAPLHVCMYCIAR